MQSSVIYKVQLAFRSKYLGVVPSIIRVAIFCRLDDGWEFNLYYNHAFEVSDSLQLKQHFSEEL